MGEKRRGGRRRYDREARFLLGLWSVHGHFLSFLSFFLGRLFSVPLDQGDLPGLHTNPFEIKWLSPAGCKTPGLRYGQVHGQVATAVIAQNGSCCRVANLFNLWARWFSYLALPLYTSSRQHTEEAVTGSGWEVIQLFRWKNSCPPFTRGLQVTIWDCYS